MGNGAVLTERQQKWFATVEANFEKATGRPVAVWVDILKGCPETRPKAQAAWLKATHGSKPSTGDVSGTEGPARQSICRTGTVSTES